MSRASSYDLGRQFMERIGQFQRPLFLLAHHDDEIPTGGLLQRLGAGKRIVWVTNSDGLYFESDKTPAEYGLLRIAEGLTSVANGGVGADAVTNLGFSEVEIYRQLSRLYQGVQTMADARPFFQAIRDRVREAVLDLRPDAVFTLAWQGGQPEHDLTHFFTMLALGDLQKATGKRPEFFHMPAYEYTILVAMRFHPLYRGQRIRLRLSGVELAAKMRMMEAYPSQVRLFGDFQKLFGIVGKIGHVTGGPKSAEEYVTIEEFGPVPEGLDYTAKPHAFDYFTYMFDDFEGVPVTFTKSVRPIVQSFLADPG
jgi:LmbE family N-acetylglucosaminyl deacetylase